MASRREPLRHELYGMLPGWSATGHRGSAQKRLMSRKRSAGLVGAAPEVQPVCVDEGVACRLPGAVRDGDGTSPTERASDLPLLDLTSSRYLTS